MCWAWVITQVTVQDLTWCVAESACQIIFCKVMLEAVHCLSMEIINQNNKSQVSMRSYSKTPIYSPTTMGRNHRSWNRDKLGIFLKMQTLWPWGEAQLRTPLRKKGHLGQRSSSMWWASVTTIISIRKQFPRNSVRVSSASSNSNNKIRNWKRKTSTLLKLTFKV